MTARTKPAVPSLNADRQTPKKKALNPKTALNTGVAPEEKDEMPEGLIGLNP